MASRLNRIRRSFDEYTQIAAIGRALQTGRLSVAQASGAIAAIESVPSVRAAVTVSGPAPVAFTGGPAVAAG